MIDFLLDTDTCIYLIKRQLAQALARLQALNISQVGIFYDRAQRIGVRGLEEFEPRAKQAGSR